MYPDRLEITSNGGLGYFGTEEEFFRGRSNPKNRELMRIFKDLGYVEEMGSGVHRILEKYPRSVFEFSQNYITVAFPFNRPVVESSVESSVETREETREEIMKLMLHNPKITTKDMAKKLHLTPKGVEWHLSNMKKASQIKRVESTKAGYWEVIKK